MHEFCNSYAPYKESPSLMFIFLLHFSYQRLLFRIKSKPDVTLRSSKHEEITFPREFISVPTRASLGQYRQKNVKSGRFGKEIFFKKKKGGGGSDLLHTTWVFQDDFSRMETEMYQHLSTHQIPVSPIVSMAIFCDLYSS